MSATPVMERAAAALAAGDWTAARGCFEEALALEESPEVLFGLGTALWWLGETEQSVQLQERAYVAFRRRPDPPSAALAAISLCLTYRASLGNYAASRGWVGRLARLVEDHDMAPLRGWLGLCHAVAANDTNDAATAEPHARQALGIARATGDPDLELCALSELGTALVQAGHVSDGTALLDEAMAGALGGEALRLETVVFTGCRAIIACSRAFEVERATQWIRAAEPFTRRYGALHLYTTCRTHYGCLLLGQGRWEEAEEELRAALRIGKSAERSLYGEALAKLAELRVAQGRPEEATELLRGFEDHWACAYPRAEIRLRAGEPEVARAILERRLHGLPADCVEAAPLVELLAAVEVALGEVDSALNRSSRMAEVGDTNGCRVMTARGSRAVGLATLATGERDGALRSLGRALEEFTRLEMPLEAARTHLLLARAFGERQRTEAVSEARAALRAFDTLGASTDADEAAALLRELGERPTRRAVGAATAGAGSALTRREREVLGLVASGLSNAGIAERLFLTRKTVEHHVGSVLSKLGVNNRTEAAAWAVRHLGPAPPGN